VHHAARAAGDLGAHLAEAARGAAAPLLERQQQGAQQQLLLASVSGSALGQQQKQQAAYLPDRRRQQQRRNPAVGALADAGSGGAGGGGEEASSLLADAEENERFLVSEVRAREMLCSSLSIVFTGGGTGRAAGCTVLCAVLPCCRFLPRLPIPFLTRVCCPCRWMLWG
jgi:hypothetical protein